MKNQVVFEKFFEKFLEIFNEGKRTKGGRPTRPPSRRHTPCTYRKGILHSFDVHCTRGCLSANVAFHIFPPFIHRFAPRNFSLEYFYIDEIFSTVQTRDNWFFNLC